MGAHVVALMLASLTWLGQEQRIQTSTQRLRSGAFVHSKQGMTLPDNVGRLNRLSGALTALDPCTALPAHVRRPSSMHVPMCYRPGVYFLAGSPSFVFSGQGILDWRRNCWNFAAKIAEDKYQPESLQRRNSTFAFRTGRRHDDVVLRQDLDGRDLAIPQQQRYNTADWLRILLKTPTSVLLRKILSPVLASMCWAAVIWVLHSTYYVSFLGDIGHVHSLLGSALGLLLVFRTNAAYQRFWEGRKIWEAVQGNVRALASLCMVYRHEVTKEKLRRIAALLCMFASLLAEHLGNTPENYYADVVTREDVLQLNRISNRPLYITNRIAQEIRSIPDQSEKGQLLFSNRERIYMLEHVNKMMKLIGEGERLVQTPVPLNYARHTSRFLSIWCLLLPLGLIDHIGAAVIPATGFASWVLFGIQEIGFMIEEPFSRTLDLDVIIKMIYIDVDETMRFPEWQKWSRKAIERSKERAAEREQDRAEESNSSLLSSVRRGTMNTSRASSGGRKSKRVGSLSSARRGSKNTTRRGSRHMEKNATTRLSWSGRFAALASRVRR
eukprot:gnl/TRDRNA2_/TRDRNA2_162026_c0_seq1.p1 gnl/TRDRNA2_/TRDRNA2_162026_c0~~gnl/TRDRNA2_/TRDRNA2_162026_c0_seq1.p1  ORF type:complete len:553 (-),score=54.62 gnl/TRDRNA2_/TRDRNA2_162026_c0_seq1:88-1746(-)